MDVNLSLDDKLVAKVQEVAAQRDMTLTELVQTYFLQLVDIPLAAPPTPVDLEIAFSRFTVNATPRTWTRAELYDRG